MNNASMDAYPHLRKILMLSQTSLTNKLKEHPIISTTMEIINFNPNTSCRATIILVRVYMRISPMETKIFQVKGAQVTIIKNKTNNLMMKSNFLKPR